MTVPTIVCADIDDVPRGIDDSYRRLPGLLATLANERIVLVFCSWRTRAEVEVFRQRIGIFHPFICENGSAAFVPTRYFGGDTPNTRAVGGYQALEFALPYQRAVDIVHRTADGLRLGILGFSDMSVEQVARECGMTLLDARLAKLREYDEPFRLLQANATAERRLFRALESAGLTCARRGAFWHAGSIDGPGPAIATLTTLYRSAFGPAVRIIRHSTSGGSAFASGDALAWLETLVAEVHSYRLGAGEIQALPDGTPAARAIGFVSAREC